MILLSRLTIKFIALANVGPRDFLRQLLTEGYVLLKGGPHRRCFDLTQTGIRRQWRRLGRAIVTHNLSGDQFVNTRATVKQQVNIVHWKLVTKRGCHFKRRMHVTHVIVTVKSTNTTISNADLYVGYTGYFSSWTPVYAWHGFITT